MQGGPRIGAASARQEGEAVSAASRMDALVEETTSEMGKRLVDWRAVLQAAIDQLEFYDGLATIKNHDRELIAAGRAVLALSHGRRVPDHKKVMRDFRVSEELDVT